MKGIDFDKYADWIKEDFASLLKREDIRYLFDNLSTSDSKTNRENIENITDIIEEEWGRGSSLKEFAISAIMTLEPTLLENFDIVPERFLEYTDLTGDLKVPDNITKIDTAGISDTLFESIELSKNIIYIDDLAFSYNDKLKKLIIYDKVEYLGDRILMGSDDLNIITYKGTKQQWYNIDKNPNWDYGSSVNIIECLDGDITALDWEQN